jgi:hypothetical protein
MLKKLAYLAQIATGLEVEQCGCGGTNAGKAEVWQLVSLTEFLQPSEGYPGRSVRGNESVLEQGILAEIKEELCPCRSFCFQCERFGILAHKLNQFSYPHLFAPIDAMKLLLLFPSPWLVPDAIEIFFVNLMRHEAVSLQPVQ